MTSFVPAGRAALPASLDEALEEEVGDELDEDDSDEVDDSVADDSLDDDSDGELSLVELELWDEELLVEVPSAPNVPHPASTVVSASPAVTTLSDFMTNPSRTLPTVRLTLARQDHRTTRGRILENHTLDAVQTLRQFGGENLRRRALRDDLPV